ncbi:MAG: hypothetical protein H0V76_02605 [Blastocatellia bacterium]|nr:hypothetical protein [Blastocatellia bacterium]
MNRILSAVAHLLVASCVSLAQDPEGAEPVYSVPDVNGRATFLVNPDLPADLLLKFDGVSFTLKVVVDAEGNAISAQCPMCHESIKATVEDAAMASKFRPLVVNGRAVRFHGSLMYTTTVERVNWFSFGTELYSAFIFHNRSLEPVSAMLSSEWAEEKSTLGGLNNRTELTVRSETILGVQRSIEGKLNAKDKWWFSLGIAMRKVTSPFQASKPFDSNEVQEALLGLEQFVASAPDGVAPEIVESLKVASSFVIPQEMSHRELWGAIRKFSQEIRPDVPSDRVK